MVLTITSLPVTGFGASAAMGHGPFPVVIMCLALWTIGMAVVALRTILPKKER